jgi:hypothetical protein
VTGVSVLSVGAGDAAVGVSVRAAVGGSASAGAGDDSFVLLCFNDAVELSGSVRFRLLSDGGFTKLTGLLSLKVLRRHRAIILRSCVVRLDDSCCRKRCELLFLDRS